MLSVLLIIVLLFFFFNHKTAYEWRISDWSSDVCSSDLTVQNDLGRMAAGLAMAFNRVHEQGVDLNGDPGKQFFTLGQPKVILGSDNTGAAEITAQLDRKSAG